MPVRDRSLNDLMQFDHVVRVHEDGRITDAEPGVYAPEVYAEVDADGQLAPDSEKEMVRAVENHGWHLLSGYSGQWGYHGPIMHPSEYVGGALEDHIRTSPGLWVACEVFSLCGSEESEAHEGSITVGWAVAYRRYG